MGQDTTFELNQHSFRDGEIVIYQRPDHKNKKWQCRVRVPNSTGYVIKSTKTTDYESAKRFGHDLWDQMRLKVMAGGTIKSKTFTELFPKFRDYLRVNTKNERRFNDIKGAIERYPLKYFIKKPVDQITTKEIQEFVQWRIQNPVKNKTNGRVVVPSPQTIRHELSSLKRYFDWLRANGHIKHDVILKPPPMSKKRRPHFTEHEWAVVTRNLREWVKEKRYYRDRFMLTQYILVLVNTGIRVGEARTLRWSDIQSQTRNENGIAVEDMILYVGGKTGKRDVVAKSADVKIYLKRIWDLRKSELTEMAKELDPTSVKEVEPALSEPVFCGRDGKPVGSFKRGFENYLKNYGLEKSVEGDKRTLYSLRHTYATFRLAHGVDVYKLAKNMGTSVEMIEKFYGHTTNQGNAAELTRLVTQAKVTEKHAWE